MEGLMIQAEKKVVRPSTEAEKRAGKNYRERQVKSGHKQLRMWIPEHLEDEIRRAVNALVKKRNVKRSRK
jgi:predicted nucleic acid-binding protein